MNDGIKRYQPPFTGTKLACGCWLHYAGGLDAAGTRWAISSRLAVRQWQWIKTLEVTVVDVPQSISDELFFSEVAQSSLFFLYQTMMLSLRTSKRIAGKLNFETCPSVENPINKKSWWWPWKALGDKFGTKAMPRNWSASLTMAKGFRSFPKTQLSWFVGGCGS